LRGQGYATMAVLTQVFPNIVDIMKGLDPDGSIAPVVEYLAKFNPILRDMVWKEGNLPTGHQFTGRTALPSPTWRRFNEGVAPAQSTKEQYTEACGQLEGFSKVDCGLAELNGNEAAFRASEDKAFIEGFNQEVVRALFYESVDVNPERIHGLSVRFDDSTTGTQKNQVIKVGTLSGANCHSIWLLGWAPDRVYGIYPKGSKAGLKMEDLGKQLVYPDSNSATAATRLAAFTAFVTHFKWQLGLAVQDYRQVVRLQVDSDDTAGAFADTSKALILAMSDAINALFTQEGAQLRWYMNRTVFGKLQRQLLSASNELLNYIAEGGRQIPTIYGIPVRITDGLVSENAVA
jgi:hypothetical protein